MRKKQTKGEKTKELIFQSALTLFKDKGFYNVTIEDITRHAGIAKGSFYSYFSTKSDIIVQEFWLIDSFYKSIEEEILSYESASERLFQFTHKQMEYVRDSIGVDLLKILYANQVSQEGSDKVIIDNKRFWHTFVERIMKEGLENGEILSTLDATILATFFNRAMRGLLLDWNISSASFDLVAEGEKYCREFILHSFL